MHVIDTLAITVPLKGECIGTGKSLQSSGGKYVSLPTLGMIRYRS